MDEASIQIEESAEPTFVGDKTGSEIIIGRLRTPWKRGDIRRLWRNVKSISSPVKAPDNFNVELLTPGHEEWLKGLLDTPEYLDRAMWRFIFQYENGRFEWTYEFKPIA